MATTSTTSITNEEKKKLRTQWLDQLSSLVETIQTWAQELDWSTRLIEKKMEDSQLGTYQAPALLLQKETIRVLLDPITRSAPGAEGVVDLYLMPAFDDIASLYYHDGAWHVHSMFPGSSSVGDIRTTDPRPFSKETIANVLEEMMKNAA